jgi:hypothetical protein
MNKEHPSPRQHMVSGSQYYRNRADVERGLKTRDFPSVEQGDPSELAQEKAIDKGKVPAKAKVPPKVPTRTPAKH